MMKLLNGEYIERNDYVVRLVNSKFKSLYPKLFEFAKIVNSIDSIKYIMQILMGVKVTG